VWPVIMCRRRLYPPITSSATAVVPRQRACPRRPEASGSSTLPVLFKMNVALELAAVPIDLETAALEDFHNAGGLGVRPRSGFAVLERDADHLGVAAQVHVGPSRVERLAQALFQLATGDQVLDVHLATHRDGLARREAQVSVAGIAAHQLF